MFGYLQGVSPDAVPYYQAAVDAGHARGLPVKLTGKYYVTTFPHKVTLPGDDGTAYPGWVAAGNDANLLRNLKIIFMRRFDFIPTPLLSATVCRTAR